MTFCGQATTHSEHPLQRAVSTTIAPFILAIISAILGVIISFEVRKGSNNSRIGKKNNEF
jgi:hypothetical protein